MSISRNAKEIPELSDYLIGKVGTGVRPADLPREDSSALGAVTVDHQSGLMCALVKPNAELGEPVGEYSLFVERGAVVHDPHSQ
jgi:hypothetical protein